jgi:hypothetical protein
MIGQYPQNAPINLQKNPLDPVSKFSSSATGVKDKDALLRRLELFYEEFSWPGDQIMYEYYNILYERNLDIQNACIQLNDMQASLVKNLASNLNQLNMLAGESDNLLNIAISL